MRDRVFVELREVATKEDHAKVRDSCCSCGPRQRRSVLVPITSREYGDDEHRNDNFDGGHDHDGGDADECVRSYVDRDLDVRRVDAS